MRNYKVLGNDKHFSATLVMGVSQIIIRIEDVHFLPTLGCPVQPPGIRETGADLIMQMRGFTFCISAVADFSNLLPLRYELAEPDIGFIQMSEKMDSPFRSQDQQDIASELHLTPINNHSGDWRQNRSLFSCENIYPFMHP